MSIYDDIHTAVEVARAEYLELETELGATVQDKVLLQQRVAALEAELAECRDDPAPVTVGWNADTENTDDNPTPDLTIRSDEGLAMAEINQRAQALGVGKAIEFVGVFDVDTTLKPLAGQTWFGSKSTRTGPKAATFRAKGNVSRGFDLKNPKRDDVTLSDLELSGFTNGNNSKTGGDGQAVILWKRSLLRRCDIHDNHQKGVGMNFDAQPDSFAVIDSCWLHHNGYAEGASYSAAGYKGVQAGQPFAAPGNAYTYRNCLIEDNTGSGLWDDHGSSGALVENCMSRNNTNDGFKWELCNGYALWKNCTATGNDQGWSIVSSAYAELQLCHSYDNHDDLQIIEAWRSKNHMHVGTPPEDVHIGSFQNGLFLEKIEVLGCKYDTIQNTAPANLTHPDAILIDDAWTP